MWRSFTPAISWNSSEVRCEVVPLPCVAQMVRSPLPFRNAINSGTLDLASVTLTTTAAPSSLLDTDTTNGLQMVIDKCSQAWTEAGTAPAYTYTCGGTSSSVLASRAVIGNNLTLSNLGSTTAGATDHLRVTLTLPSGAGNTLQNQSSTITYAFTGTQRAATNK